MLFRNQQSAKIFAIKYGIPNAMEGYEALAASDEVNVVYVGTINTTHLHVVKVIELILKFCMTPQFRQVTSKTRLYVLSSGSLHF